ncbi:MAG: sugar ABC transporter permease [Oscillospiraceae bacterium]|jgi:raffinose/stachyose/melibiose transport system permease protein|nr:sugar ABC transporter permease [Oscillospiraceae bacterium]
MDSMIYKRKWPLVIFLIPAFALMTVFIFYPFLMNILNSFQKVGSLGTGPVPVNEAGDMFWTGNYEKLFTDKTMGVAVRNTLLMMCATVIFQVGIALLLALLVDSIRKGAQTYRTIYFFPIVISASALGLLFNMVFLYDGGMLNEFLLRIGVIGRDELGNPQWIDWKDRSHAFFTMIVPVVWQYVGFYFVILATGLNNVETDIYEAAAIDGANGLQRIRFITLPLIRNTLITCLTLALIGALKVFDLPWQMFPKGIPLNSTYLTGTYMYQQTFAMQNVGYGATIAVVIALMGVAVSQLSNLIFRPRDI